MSGVDETVRAARGGSGEDLWLAIRKRHPAALADAALNRNLTEDMAIFIAKCSSTPAEALGFLAGDARFKDSYPLKLAICRNPRCPQRVALGLIKHLRIFDLADITRDQRVPVMLRRKIEMVIEEKAPSMPPGIKKALSRRACTATVMKLMEKGDRKVVETCLQSPTLTEEAICRAINRETVKPVLVRAIAEDRKWSLRYGIRYALTRNFHTPLALVVGFLESMKTRDLQDLHEDPSLPTATRPFIYRELVKRGAPLEPEEDEVYELPEDYGDLDEAEDDGA